MLYDRVVARCRDDERVRGVWLSGSLARGTADRASDLDFLLAVADDDLDEFAASIEEWIATITPTVLLGRLPFLPGSIHTITPAFERFDIVVERVSALPTTFFTSRVLVFDRNGEGALVPEPSPLPGPSPERVEKLVTDWFQFSAVETIVWREDWLLGTEHLHVLRSLLYQLYVEWNAPLPPTGVKRWSEKLTVRQREVLASLPTAVHGRDDLRTAQLAYTRAFLDAALPLAASTGATWPTDLAAAATRHVHEVLEVEAPY